MSGEKVVPLPYLQGLVLLVRMSKAVAVLPGGFGAMLGTVRSEFMSSALYGCEASERLHKGPS